MSIRDSFAPQGRDFLHTRTSGGKGGGTSQFLTEMGERAQGRVLEGKEKVVIIIMT